MDGTSPGAGVYIFERFELNPRERTCSREGVAVPLTSTVFNLLLCFVGRAGELVAKDELIATVWNGRIVGDSTLTQTVFSLRKALEAAGAPSDCIVTVPGFGYRFDAEVQVGDRSRPPRVAPQALGASPGGPRRRASIVALVSGCAILALLAGLFAIIRRPTGREGPPVVVVQAEFQNLTGERVFDAALGRVIESDIGQSPHLRILGAQEVRGTLGLMTRPQDGLLTPDLARQVCIRNAGRAVVEGSLAHVGAAYLLSVRSFDCDDGRLLTSDKALVARREAIVPALDRLIGKTRRRLGETPASVGRFDVSLMQSRTASLEALEAYAEGVRQADRGRNLEAIAMLEHAVALDPSFAAAYLELARADFNTDRYAEARTSMRRAFELRQSVGEDQRYSIEILRALMIDLDYARALQLAKAATATYPGHWIGWSQQADLNIQLGRYGEAAEAARRAVAISPGRESAHAMLAEALADSGRYDEAARACADAAARGVAGGMIARARVQIALARGDEAGFADELRHARGQAWESSILVIAGADAFRRGQIRRGEALFGQADALVKAGDQTGYFDGLEALSLALAGETSAARARITPLPPDTEVMSLSLVDTLLTLAEAGDESRTGALLSRTLQRGPADTMLRTEFAPETRAALDLAERRPAQAIGDLAPATLYEARDTTAPDLRGRAELALGKGAEAAAEFRKIIDHPGVDPWDIRHALAWLGLARAERLEGHLDASRGAYTTFLRYWRDADPDAPALLQAREELAALTTGRSARKPA